MFVARYDVVHNWFALPLPHVQVWIRLLFLRPPSVRSKHLSEWGVSHLDTGNTRNVHTASRHFDISVTGILPCLSQQVLGTACRDLQLGAIRGVLVEKIRSRNRKGYTYALVSASKQKKVPANWIFPPLGVTTHRWAAVPLQS